MTSSPSLREVLAERVTVADGTMGTTLQAHDVTMDDFRGHEGCNEVLNVTRPDSVRAVRKAYFEVGVDRVEPNTFGADPSALGEYHISERVFEYSEAGARVAREAADAHSTPGRPRFVLGSIGPGTKLPSILIRLSGLPQPGGPGAADGAARSGQDRCRAVGGVPAPPEQSTSALIVHHPEANYFNV
ncbi:homocysteine S-methyltransferase family protein [Streptosporangium sp. NPDC006930]|uniref:homocysteine S-methyltransferase family protein n=1 Tax=unclassified Streptosporangium TaxID=2632669 RepID=UPI00342FF9B6